MHRHPDGPVDQRIDVSHLSEQQKKSRQKTYETWKVQGGTITTAAGKLLDFDLGRRDNHVYFSKLKWKVNGQVSVPKMSCRKCAEINSCRKKGTPPFICLIRADDRHIRRGTSVCALCYCYGQGALCDAVKAVHGSSIQSSGAETSPSTTRSGTDQREESMTCPTSDSENSEVQEVVSSAEESGDEDCESRCRTNSGRIIRLVDRYNDTQAVANAMTKSTPAPGSTSSRRGQSGCSSGAVDRPTSNAAASCGEQQQGKVDKSKAGLKQSQVGGRARELRQHCIKTAKQLLSLELAELEEELHNGVE